VVARYAESIGDDCGVVPFGRASIVATTDPVPKPAASAIGGDDDLFWMGWLLVTINASDLAAAGAEPLGFMAALEMPALLESSELERLLSGIRGSCDAQGLAYLGGNLREAGTIAGVGTAIGVVREGPPLTRSGMREGDALLSIGNGGVFWRDALLILRQLGMPEKDESPVFRPLSCLAVMSKLREGGVVAAMDNSDGLLPTLEQLAEKNGCGIVLNLDALKVPGCEKLVGIDEARLWLGWGDWTVVGATRPESAEAVVELARSTGYSATVIGKCEGADPVVLLESQGKRVRAPRVESERFAADSWFSSGLDTYIETLLTVPLR